LKIYKFYYTVSTPFIKEDEVQAINASAKNEEFRDFFLVITKLNDDESHVSPGS
jgi:hypothetical protein